MKKLVVLLLAVGFVTSAFADQSVRGYTRKDGTVVQGYQRTEPNNTKDDNYSTRGNTNPYNGRKGTKRGDSDAND